MSSPALSAKQPCKPGYLRLRPRRRPWPETVGPLPYQLSVRGSPSRASASSLMRLLTSWSQLLAYLPLRDLPIAERWWFAPRFTRVGSSRALSSTAKLVSPFSLESFPEGVRERQVGAFLRRSAGRQTSTLAALPASIPPSLCVALGRQAGTDVGKAQWAFTVKAGWGNLQARRAGAGP